MKVQRRTIDFHSADEVIEDINHLRKTGYHRLGNWNLTQICQHLNATMVGGMDGFGYRVPWIVRATVAKWAFASLLRKRKIRSGLPTFKTLRPHYSEPTDDDQLIDQCIDTCRRAASFTGSLKDYPLLDDLSVEDWREFAWIHASHHLSFLIPNETAPDS